jgi:hypothetical protein
MLAKSAQGAEGEASHVKDEKCQKCHRRQGHLAPHHADSGQVWLFTPGRGIRARHYTDCPSRQGKCVGVQVEDGKCHQCHRRVGHRGPHHADSGLVWGGRWRRVRTRPRHYTDCPGRGGFIGVAALFLPGTWPARLMFLAVVLFSASGPFRVGNPVNLALFLTASIVLIAAVLLLANKIEVPRGSGLPALLDSIFQGSDLDEDVWIFRALVMFVVVIAVFGAGFFLTFLVANGATSKGASKGTVIWAQDVLLLVTMWLVFGVPNQAYTIKLAKDGYAQRVLVGVITAAACALTGTYLFLLSLSGGPLRNIKTGQLVAAIVFTVVLVAPFYRSLARACWQRGIGGFVSPEAVLKAWHRLAEEVQAALDQRAIGTWTICNEKVPEEDKQVKAP